MKILLRHKLFTRLQILLLLFGGIGLTAYPQTKCGSEDYERQFNTDSAFLLNQKEYGGVLKNSIKSNNTDRNIQTQTNNNIITIPVVIHVLWNNLQTLISKEQIQSQIDALNNDFQLKNTDAYKCPDVFKPFQANCQIAFKLANRDPNGNSTDGIIYKQTSNKSFKPYEAKLSIFGGDDIWDRDSYLNIWVVPKLLSILGVQIWGDCPRPGTLIPTPKTTDGAVIDYSYFGTIGTALPNYRLGRTATHEIGHWLNLKHIWGDSKCGDDDVEDTPTQEADNADLYPIPLMPFVPKISCNNAPNGEMFMNYMDYTFDEGMNMFTQGQKEKMRACFKLGGQRYSLLFTQALTGISDLVILNPSITPLSVTAGNSFSTSFIEKNIGSEASGANYVNIHLSPNDKLTPGENGDIYLDQYYVNKSLAPFTQTDLLSKQITIPSNTAPGTYYIFFAADGTGAVDETDNANNFATAIIKVTKAQSQFQTSYRYWFDNQFTQAITGNVGYGNDNSLLQADIPVNQLSDGLHSVHMGFKDKNGKWSSISSSLFFKQAIKVAGSAQYQYWFDNDFLNGTINFVAPSAQSFITTDLDVSSLAKGLHTLNIRFRPDGGKWSSTTSSFFYRTSEGTNNVLRQYQYWFDNNSRNAITVNLSSGSDLNLDSNINIKNLSKGLHVFNIRFKQDNGVWSTVKSDFFNNDIGGVIYNKITAYRYWFDNTFANRITINGSFGSNYELNKQISVTQLADGLHIFNMAFKDSGSAWSCINSSFFYKQTSVAGIPTKITSYQYWFDSNSQNMITVNTDSTFNFDMIAGIMANNLSKGLHVFNIRFKQNNGLWSAVKSDFFNNDTSQGVKNKIISYRYWFDNNFANRTTINGSFGSNFELNKQFSVSQLADGLHAFNLAFKDSGLLWSSISSSFFYKQKSVAGTKGKITNYQYWFDNDSKNSIAVNAVSSSNLDLVANIITDSLSKGLHVFNICFQQDSGVWSAVKSDFFYNDFSHGIKNKITTFRYWFDSSYQNFKETSLGSLPGNTFLYNLDGENLSTGVHMVSSMFKDTNGIWSSVVTSSFTKKSTSKISVQPRVMISRAQVNVGAKQLITGSEFTLHGNIELLIRSIGGDLIKTNNSFTYLSNGRFTYQLPITPSMNGREYVVYAKDVNTGTASTLVNFKVLNTVMRKPLVQDIKIQKIAAISINLVPNPAHNLLNIYTSGLQQDKQTTVSIISASGIVVKTIQANGSNKTIRLNLSSLANGMYIIKLISGEKVLYKKFVKM